jgi:hypothetical protein
LPTTWRPTRSRVFSILANVSEEGFHIETIPFLRGADRQAIIARKLGQLFFNAKLQTALSLGHQKSRRKDERIMLAALTRPEVLPPGSTPWPPPSWLSPACIRCRLLAPLLLRKLGIGAQPCLLLTIQDQSLRQSYLENGELHFSRLTPLHNSSISGIAQTFSSEALKLQQYLVGQRLIGRKQPIKAYLLAHASARKAIENSCVDSEALSFTVLDIEDSARNNASSRRCLTDTHCEPLFLNLLATDPPRTRSSPTMISVTATISGCFVRSSAERAHSLVLFELSAAGRADNSTRPINSTRRSK